jgi:hypothetical protein
MQSSDKRTHPVADTMVIILAATALHTVLAWQFGTLSEGALRDTDAYMRLVRVQELWQTGSWYQTVTSSLGAPDGLSLHWTRPLDILILLPALVLHLGGMAIGTAIYWSGALISPLLHFLTCLAAARAAKPIWERHGAWRVAALVILFNGAAITYSMVGRPDHHSLGLLVTVLGAGQTIRAVLAPADAKKSYGAGALAAMGIWISPESLVGVAPALITFGLLWLAKTSDGIDGVGRHWAQLGRRFCLGMAATLLLAIAVEQPPANWLTPEYDKVSILHLAIALLAALDFALAAAMPWTDWRRVTAAGLVAFLSALALTWLFPRFYLGPLGDVTDQTVRIFLDDVKEMAPLWPTSEVAANQFFGLIGNTLAALPVIPYCLWRWWRQPAFAAGLFLSLSFITALVGALLHQRLAVPLSAFGAILGCGLFAILCDLVINRMPITRAVTRFAAAAIVVFGGQFWLVFTKAPAANATTPANVASVACDPVFVADWLNTVRPGIVTEDPLGAQRTTPIILTESINYSPDLAYRTPYRFVGGPYHRGIDDIADMFNVAIGTDDTQIREIVSRRQADYILICIREVPKAIGESAPGSLYHRLLRGESPSWLQPVAMSAEAAREFRLFAVQR